MIFFEKNRRIKVILFSLLLVAFIGVFIVFPWIFVNALTEESKQEYPIGRDTEVAFGDGKYQIFRLPDGIYCLDGVGEDNLYNGMVYSYREIAPRVFAVGGSGYIVLNYENDELMIEDDPEKLPNEFREVFEEKNSFIKLTDNPDDSD